MLTKIRKTVHSIPAWLFTTHLGMEKTLDLFYVVSLFLKSHAILVLWTILGEPMPLVIILFISLIIHISPVLESLASRA